jgi:hypothetical protein
VTDSSEEIADAVSVDTAAPLPVLTGGIRRPPPPRSVTAVSLLLLLYHMAGLLVMPASRFYAISLTVGILFRIIDAVLLYFFWRGHNWARWVNLVRYTLSGLVSGWLIMKPPAPRQAYSAVTVLVVIFFWIWANTDTVADYFAPSSPRT